MSELRSTAEPAVYFLDANVPMYAIGRPHPYRGPCIQLLKRIETGRIHVVTSVEVLQELLHRYISLDAPDVASTVFTSTKKLCDEILPVQEGDLDRAHELLRDQPGIAVRDAVHAATMLNRGLSLILSTDRHFDDISGIERIDPIELIQLRQD